MSWQQVILFSSLIGLVGCATTTQASPPSSPRPLAMPTATLSPPPPEPPVTAEPLERSTDERIFGVLGQTCFEQEEPAACARYAERAAANGVAPEQRRRALEIACYGQEGRSCEALATAWFTGEGGARDRARARVLYMRQCERDLERGAAVGFSCLQGARMAASGEGGRREEEAADRLYRLSCEAGIWRACAELGRREELGVALARPDLQGARARYERASENGDALGYHYLAEIYFWGRGVHESQERARELYLSGCEAGEGDACTRLGQYAQFGLGGEAEDFALARVWFERGCAQGSARGCISLGMLMEAGLGGERSPEQARTIYERECARGEQMACHNLGFLYERGRGVARDVTRARELYRQACEQGEEGACRRGAVLGLTR